MMIDTLLEALDNEEPPLKSNLSSYQDQFAEHGFCTVDDLQEMEHFTPKILGELFHPELHFATSLQIMKCAKEEVLQVQNAFYSGDQTIIC